VPLGAASPGRCFRWATLIERAQAQRINGPVFPACQFGLPRAAAEADERCRITAMFAQWAWGPHRLCGPGFGDTFRKDLWATIARLYRDRGFSRSIHADLSVDPRALFIEPIEWKYSC
jgi:hypothetical protein